VAVEGKLRWSEWDDKNTGDKRSKIEVIADDIEFMSSRNDSGGGYSAPAQRGSAAPSPETIEDDIPF